MDIIKALENFNYYHSVTGRSLEEWKAWKQKTVREWGFALGNKDSTAVLKGLYGYCVTEAQDREWPILSSKDLLMVSGTQQGSGKLVDELAAGGILGLLPLLFL